MLSCVYQKLQMLNSCIEQQKSTAQGVSASSNETDGWDLDLEVEEVPSSQSHLPPSPCPPNQSCGYNHVQGLSLIATVQGNGP